MNCNQAGFLKQSTAGAQRGVALVIGLIFLVLMSIIGIAAMSNASLQEQISGNSVRKNIVFQQAEQDLDDVETLLLNTTSVKPYVIMVLHDASIALADSDLLDANNWDCASNDNDKKCVVQGESMAKVEHLSDANSMNRFRVTVRTQDGKSVVTLQSIFVR